MTFRSTVSAFLALACLAAAVPSFALVQTARDAELVAALQDLGGREKIHLTANDYEALNYGLNAALIGLNGSAIAGVAAFVNYAPDHVIKQFHAFTPEQISRARTFITRHGPRAAVAALGLFVVNLALHEGYSAQDRGDAANLRAASAKDASVYRAQIAHFLKLSFSEQFLIAKQDQKLTDDLIALSQSQIAADAQKAAAQSK